MKRNVLINVVMLWMDYGKNRKNVGSYVNRRHVGLNEAFLNVDGGRGLAHTRSLGFLQELNIIADINEDCSMF